MSYLSVALFWLYVSKLLYIVERHLTLKQIYNRYSTHKKCVEHLEKVYWDDAPRCPYCTMKNYSIMPKECRYHCNVCKCSFSVTVRTMFHKTKVDLQKWFFAIQRNDLSIRKLTSEIGVSKDTASFMKKRINDTDKEIINNIIKGLT